MFANSNGSQFSWMDKLKMICLGASIGELLSADFPAVRKFLQDFEGLPKSYDSLVSL